MPEYVLIENNTIKRHVAASSPPAHDWRLVTENWPGVPGMDARFFDWDNGGIPKTEAQLIKEGILCDYRGDWWDTKTKQKHVIDKPGIEPKPTWTNTPPPTDVPLSCLRWTGEIWEIDESVQQREELQSQLAELKVEFQNLSEQLIEYAIEGAEPKKAAPTLYAQYKNLQQQIQKLEQDLEKMNGGAK